MSATAQRLEPAAGMPDDWFVELGGEVRVMTLDELDQAFLAGILDLTSSVWTHGMQDWATLGGLLDRERLILESGSMLVGEAPIEVDVEDEEEITLRSPGGAVSLALLEPRAGCAAPLPLVIGSLGSTAPVVRSSSKPANPRAAAAPKRHLPKWAAAIAAMLGLGLYAASVMQLAPRYSGARHASELATTALATAPEPGLRGFPASVGDVPPQPGPAGTRAKPKLLPGATPNAREHAGGSKAAPSKSLNRAPTRKSAVKALSRPALKGKTSTRPKPPPRAARKRAASDVGKSS